MVTKVTFIAPKAKGCSGRCAFWMKPWLQNATIFYKGSSDEIAKRCRLEILAQPQTIDSALLAFLFYREWQLLYHISEIYGE